MRRGGDRPAAVVRARCSMGTWAADSGWPGPTSRSLRSADHSDPAAAAATAPPAKHSTRTALSRTSPGRTDGNQLRRTHAATRCRLQSRPATSTTARTRRPRLVTLRTAASSAGTGRRVRTAWGSAGSGRTATRTSPTAEWTASGWSARGQPGAGRTATDSAGSGRAGRNPLGEGQADWDPTASGRAGWDPTGSDRAVVVRAADGRAGSDLVGSGLTGSGLTGSGLAGSGPAGSGPGGQDRTAADGIAAGPTAGGRTVADCAGLGRAGPELNPGPVGSGRRAGRGVRDGWGASRRRTSCWREARPATGSGTRAWRRCHRSTTTAHPGRSQDHPSPAEDRSWRGRAGSPQERLGPVRGLGRLRWGGGGSARDRAPVGGSADRQPGRSPGAGSSCPTSILLTTLLGGGAGCRFPRTYFARSGRTRLATPASRLELVSPTSPAPPMRPRCCTRSGCARSTRAVPSSCGSAGRRGRSRCRSCWRSATATGPGTAR